VSYVFGTRFTPDRGFLVESRRGSGGFLRIIRIVPHPSVIHDILSETGEAVSEERLLGVVVWLQREGLVSRREASMIRSALDSRSLLAAARAGDALRARLLRSMLLALLTEGGSWAGGPPGTGDQER
jgi:transcriptional regulator CtsR